MTNEEKVILEKCGIHYENDTLEKEIALRVIAETRKQFKEYLEKTKEWLKEKIYNDNYWGYDNEGPFLMQTNFSPTLKPI